jgi:hypothetical protein
MKHECKITLKRFIEVENKEEVQNQFWEDLEQEFIKQNTNLVIELNESMIIKEIKNKNTLY